MYSIFCIHTINHTRYLRKLVCLSVAASIEPGISLVPGIIFLYQDRSLRINEGVVTTATVKDHEQLYVRVKGFQMVL